MFREGRQVKINTSVYEQIRYLFRRNFMENRLKIHEKSGKTGIRNKNRQKCCPWGSLFGIESILGQFLDSGGNPKIIQNLRGLLNQVVSGAIWKQLCAFERLLMDFGSILGPFWAPPKPILGQFGVYRHHHGHHHHHDHHDHHHHHHHHQWFIIIIIIITIIIVITIAMIHFPT